MLTFLQNMTSNDDSLHITLGGNLTDATDMTGYASSNWKWKSLQMDGTSAYLYATKGYRDINMHAREDGMRVDRILLSRILSFNPTSAGIRCGAQGL